MTGPAHEVRHAESALPNIVLSTAERPHGFQSGLLRIGLHEVRVLGLVHAAVVAREDDQRVLREAFLVQHVEHAAYAEVEIADEVAKRPTLAFACRGLRGRDRVVHGHRREIDEKRLLRALLADPVHDLVRERLHHVFIDTLRRVQIERFGRFALLLADRDIRRTWLRRAFFVQTEHPVVFDIHTAQIAVIRGNAEVVIETDLERPGLQFLRVVAFLRRAVTKMPFADRRAVVALVFEHGGHR